MDGENRRDDNSTDSKRLSDYLASERTFLAWVRTSIAIISLGFVISRFSIWLKELAATTGASARVHTTGGSMVIGLGMIAAGGIFAVLAMAHYSQVNRAIKTGDARPTNSLTHLLTGFVVLLAVASLVYMIITGNTGF